MAIRISISQRMISVAFLGIILLGASLSVVFTQIRSTMLLQKQHDVQHAVEAAATIVEDLVRKAKAGTVT